jgi:hypothetical protein
MPEKLIRLPQLQRFKAKADLKYQNKLVAGDNINISGNTISAIATPSNPTYTKLDLSDRYIDSTILSSMGSITLMPGTYFLVYTCYFPDVSGGGYRQCGFSTNTTDITGFGRSWGDFRKDSGGDTQTCVAGVFNISASSYPDGQTFYFLARQNSGNRFIIYPDCSYVKLA